MLGWTNERKIDALLEPGHRRLAARHRAEPGRRRPEHERGHGRRRQRAGNVLAAPGARRTSSPRSTTSRWSTRSRICSDEHERLIRRRPRSSPTWTGSSARSERQIRGGRTTSSRGSTAGSAASSNDIATPSASLAETQRGPRRARTATRPGRTSPRSPPCWPRPGTSSRAPPRPATRRRRAAAQDDHRAGRASATTRMNAAEQPDRRARWETSAGSTRSRRASSTTPSSRRTATGSCTSGSPMTTCPGSSARSRRT